MHDHDRMILTGHIKPNDITQAGFCYICRNHVTFLSLNNKWKCCSCNPLLLADPKLIGFTIGEVINLRNRRKTDNGQEYCVQTMPDRIR